MLAAETVCMPCMRIQDWLIDERAKKKGPVSTGPFGLMVQFDLVDGARTVGGSRLLWFRLRDDRGDWILLERSLKNFIEVMHVSDLHIAQNVRRKIRHGIRFA